MKCQKEENCDGVFLFKWFLSGDGLVFCLSGESGVRYAGDRRGLRFIAWNKSRECLMFPNSPGSVEAVMRNLPPYAVGDPNNLVAMGLLAANKGKKLTSCLSASKFVQAP
ncbi:putative micrococcal nuclease [Helianthus anomalus]